MKRLILFAILLAIFGLAGTINQILENYKHYDIFANKNRGAYNIQRNTILNSNNLNTLKNIALAKLVSSIKFFVNKSDLAKRNNTSLDIIAVMLFGCLVALIIVLIYAKGGCLITKCGRLVIGKSHIVEYIPSSFEFYKYIQYKKDTVK